MNHKMEHEKAGVPKIILHETLRIENEGGERCPFRELTRHKNVSES
jgi:hypothetical protein